MWKGMPSNCQELFDQCVTHLLTQNEQGTDDNDNCVYRGQGGKKCAIGGILPDSLYEPCFENHQASLVLIRIKHPRANVPTRESCLTNGWLLPITKTKFLKLADELQIMHDEVYVEDWYNSLLNIGKEFNLRLDVLHTFKES
jgi:hypothetical protein